MKNTNKKLFLPLNIQFFNGEQNTRIKEIEARKADLSKELEKEDADLDAIEKELKELREEQEEIEKRQRIQEELAGMKQQRGNPSDSFIPFDGNGQEDPEKEYRKAFMDYVTRGTSIPAETRADANTKTTDVGEVIPETIMNRIVEKLEATGMILPLVTRTAIKGGVSVPTSSVKPSATWVNEGEGSPRQKKTTSHIQFAYHKLRCAVSVSLEVETMALSVFENQLINNVVEAMIKAIEQAIVDGNGSGKPKGILAETPATGQALDIEELKFKTLTDAEGALPMEYEADAVWTMTKKTFMAFQAMTDEQGQPIARTNYGINGRPERVLMGRPVVLCNYIDSFGTASDGDVFAYLFNYSDYMLNTNYQMGVKKYEDNETDDMVTKAIMIADGKVIDKNSLVTLKKATPTG